MLKKLCCIFLAVMMLSTFSISAEDVNDAGSIGEKLSVTDNVSVVDDDDVSGETIEFDIPTDEDSFLHPDIGLEYSEGYTAQTGEIIGGGVPDITPMMLPLTDSVREGIKNFQQYINDNLPMDYLGKKLRLTGAPSDLMKTAAIKLIQYRLNILGAGLAVDGAFGPASQAAFSKYVGTIERYNSGVWVYILQGLLYSHLYDPNGFDGSYGVNGGTGCLNAVNSFKTRNLITEGGSGSVGIKTMMCLTWRTPERTVDDGVYYIRNTLGTYLHTQNGGITSGTNVYAYSKYSDGAAETIQIRQLWKVTYLGDGFYTIRPMHKPDMALTVENGNAVIKPADPQNAQFKWEIYEYDLGIIIRHRGDTSQRLYIAGDSTAAGANVCVGSNYSSNQKWSLIKITNPPEGAIIYRKSSSSVIANGHRWIAKDDFTAFFSDFDMAPTFYSPYTDSQDFTWTSSNPDIATVSPNGIGFVGKAVGMVLIQGRKVRGDRVYYVNFNLHVTPVPSGVYYMQNIATHKYVDIENQNMSNGTQIHQWNFHGGTTQTWRLHLDNIGGYYTIRSERNSTYYLGVQNDSSANDVPVVLRSGTITSGMKWDITVSSHGNYVLTPRTGIVNGNNRVLAVEYYVNNSNGLDMQQRDFVDDVNFKDEWMLYYHKQYGLAYLGYDPGHTASMQEIAQRVCYRWGPNGYAYLNLSKQTALALMSSVNVFSCITHGKQNSIDLANGETLTSADINALPNFRALDLVYYGACLTGSGGTNNLVNATLNKGAAAVVGFKHQVDPAETYYWTEQFMWALADRKVTIAEAMNWADDVTGNHPAYQNHQEWSVWKPEDRLAVGDLDITVYY